MTCPQQENYTDCGVFVLMISYLLVRGLDPGSLNLQRSVSAFREHLALAFRVSIARIAESQRDELRSDALFELHTALAMRASGPERSHVQRFKECLTACGRRLINVVGDGDCMLHAVNATLGEEGQPWIVRRSHLVNMLLQNQDARISTDDGPGDNPILREWSCPLRGTDWGRYIVDMTIDGEWCDERMLMATAAVLNRPIQIISSAGGPVLDIPVPRHWTGVATGPQAPGSPLVLGHYPERHYVGTARTGQNSGAVAEGKEAEGAEAGGAEAVVESEEAAAPGEEAEVGTQGEGDKSPLYSEEF